MTDSERKRHNTDRSRSIGQFIDMHMMPDDAETCNYLLKFTWFMFVLLKGREHDMSISLGNIRAFCRDHNMRAKLSSRT